jgi:hypothetical protein
MTLLILLMVALSGFYASLFHRATFFDLLSSTPPLTLMPPSTTTLDSLLTERDPSHPFSGVSHNDTKHFNSTKLDNSSRFGCDYPNPYTSSDPTWHAYLLMTFGLVLLSGLIAGLILSMMTLDV